MRRILVTIMMLSALLTVASLVGAQDENTLVPAVEVSGQASVDGTVFIERAAITEPGWLVIHADADGAPGPVIGFRAINAGDNFQFNVPVDVARATPTLYAMLHTDDNTIGEYEFGEVEGADGPVTVDGAVVTPSFEFDAVLAADQFVTEDNTVTVPAVVAQNEGWMVIHADNGEGGPGPVLGATFVPAGLSTNAVVELQGEATATLFAMLHEDTGVEATYEFGDVEGVDLPVVVNGVQATASFRTVPNVIATQQIVTDTFVADSVLSDGPGWLVIHANADGAPGEVIGAEFVEDGYNTDVAVSLNTDAEITPVLFPMLHVDTGEAGAYEFGEVEGADGPVTVDGNVLTFPMLVAPSFTASAQPVSADGSINIATVLSDSPGWMVIHADNGDGAPGPVIGFSPVLDGLNRNVGVLLVEEPTATVFPMLHVDTGELGAYEFGAVEGADGPVTVNGDVVVGPLELEGVE
jgi:hypothetical protein